MDIQKAPEGRLITVSNRLPFVVAHDPGGEWRIEAGAGGLITALDPVLRNRRGLWIGWPGTVEVDGGDIDRLLWRATGDVGYALKQVTLSAEERDKFYLGFSNEIIWPLFHDFQSRCNFDPSYWITYELVNRKFAEVTARNSRFGDYIWVHDYHLINVASELRALGLPNKLGFFLHIPFPPLDIFLTLPWRFQILRALLDYDVIGFQTLRDRRNFVQCVRALLKDVTIQGKGQVIAAQVGGRTVRAGVFPIGIDFQEFSQGAASSAVAEAAWYFHEAFANRTIIFGIDRLDYTKGIPEKLSAFRHTLKRYPELRERVTLVQVIVPSREDIPEYSGLKVEIERLVGEINGQFSRAAWAPILYMYQSLSRVDLLAYYRASEIALITPLKDGMNLVAKEYCAASLDGGVLILSEFAGAAAQLQRDALLVNPYDVDGMAAAIQRACTMPLEERRARMRNLRRAIRERDIFWWVDSFLRAGTARDLDDFTLVEEVVPNWQLEAS
ncbi:MAG TPA: trehalose-6-phosphate synthase [Roseiflexaceae bacterium]|nr:trehalose-6-phosphate synthase [Roseiflexaceae bacterium]